MKKLEEKKQDKRRRLLDSAYECFTRRGVSGTTIAEICKRSGVAKGTFYLYFLDKDDIARELNRRITFELIQGAYLHMMQHRSEDFGENLIAMADYTIDRFEQDTTLIRIIKHDFIWPVREADLFDSEHGTLIPGYLQIQEYSRRHGVETKETLAVLYCIVGMLVSVCYDAIIEGNPTTMDEMRPIVHKIIHTQIPA